LGFLTKGFKEFTGTLESVCSGGALPLGFGDGGSLLQWSAHSSKTHAVLHVDSSGGSVVAQRRGGCQPKVPTLQQKRIKLPNHEGFDLLLKSASGLGNRIESIEIDFDLIFCCGELSFDASVYAGDTRKTMAGGLGWRWAVTSWW
jgi:hypothetical protein